MSRCETGTGCVDRADCHGNARDTTAAARIVVFFWHGLALLSAGRCLCPLSCHGFCSVNRVSVSRNLISRGAVGDEVTTEYTTYMYILLLVFCISYPAVDCACGLDENNVLGPRLMTDSSSSAPYGEYIYGLTSDRCE